MHKSAAHERNEIRDGRQLITFKHMQDIRAQMKMLESAACSDLDPADWNHGLRLLQDKSRSLSLSSSSTKVSYGMLERVIEGSRK